MSSRSDIRERSVALTHQRHDLSGALGNRSRRRRLGRIAHNYPLAVIGCAMLIVIVLASIFAGPLSPADPVHQSIVHRLEHPLTTGSDNVRHLLGTDELGRDILSRILYGSRISLIVSFVSVLIAASGGLLLGLISGYFGRWVDSLVMALVNLQLAFPYMLLALAIVAFLGASLTNLIIVFVVTGWPIYARTIRAAILGIKEQEYVQAARAMGASNGRILYRHLLPNVVSPLTVLASYNVAQMILLEAGLGFLGLSVQPPTPTWGNMLADGRQYIQTAWWLAAFPGIAIMLTAAAVNFVGDGLRDFIDPTS